MMLVLLMLLAWELAVHLFSIPKFLLPSPSSILLKMVAAPDLLMRHALVTTRETLEGFGLAVVVGIVLAVMIVHSRLAEESLYPILLFLQITPKMAIAPLLIVWMGFGEWPKIAIAFLIAFSPIVIDTITGLKATEPELIEMLLGLRATRRQILIKARFPSAVPFIFSAMRISITLAVTGAVVAEFVGASDGLGHLIVVSSSNIQTDITFAAVLTLALIGAVLFWLIGVTESLVVRRQGAADHHAVPV
jgi:NitT/TauT family transport system permease protein